MVRGKFKFDTSEAIPSGQRIKISIEDTSRLDIDAIQIADQIVTIPEGFDTAANDLPFELGYDVATEGLTLKAHMPRHAGDDIRKGDMLTTSTIRLESNKDITVTLQRV
ncbi:MAG: hypothetical protein ABJ360_20995 [Roseobacter sp.]